MGVTKLPTMMIYRYSVALLFLTSLVSGNSRGLLLMVVSRRCLPGRQFSFIPKQHQHCGQTMDSRLFNLKNLEWRTPSDDQLEKWMQSYGEQSRKFRRDVFTAADWVKSRRPERFFKALKKTFDSNLTRVIRREIMNIGKVAVFVVLYNNSLVHGWTLLGRQSRPLAPWMPPLKLPLAPFSLCFGALGLLLTFRTNVSYQRWNEARTAWGKVINDSRSLARMACVWARAYPYDDPNDRLKTQLFLERLGEALCSFSRSLMNRTLTPQEDEKVFRKYCRERLSDVHYSHKLSCGTKHRPTCALAEITTIVSRDLSSRLPHPTHHVELERTISGLCDALGACERLLTSPVPTFYPRFAARFVLCWLLTLPLALYDIFGKTWNRLGMIPVVLVISGFLLGVEELSTQMEEPFSILPMERMCEDSIRIPIMELIQGSSSIVSDTETDDDSNDWNI